MYLIDIDGTISRRNIERFLSICNEEYDLGLLEEQRASMTYLEFLECPEVTVARQRIAKFDISLKWMDLDPRLILASRLMPGAVEGVCKLAQHGEIAYYTARSHFDTAKHNGITESTKQWLKNNQFPCADRVVFCRNVADKLIKIAELIEKTEQSVVLIDDAYKRIFVEYERLCAGTCPLVTADIGRRYAQLLKDKLIYAAIGVTNVLEQYQCQLRVMPLAGWHDVTVLQEREGFSWSH